MSDEDFFLVEEWTAPPVPPAASVLAALVLPEGKRSPITPGYVLTWREVPVEGEPYQRLGLVVGLAPRARSVWVQPDDPRPGEGFAVVVDNVTEADCAGAERRLGVPGDYLSSVGWQQPLTLPRAVIRIDRYVSGGTETPHRYLHADRRCPGRLPSPFPGDSIRHGRARRLDECYVFQGYLHPASVRPLNRSRGAYTYVPVCGVCLKPGAPG